MKSYALELDGTKKGYDRVIASAKQSGNAFSKFGDALMNAGIAALASVTISLLIKGLDKLIVTTEEHREQLANAKAEYDGISTKLTDVNSEIDSTSSRIAELKQGGISVIEEEEYNRLVDLNIELGRTKQLLTAQQDVAGRNVSAEYVATMRSAYLLGSKVQTSGTPIGGGEAGGRAYASAVAVNGAAQAGFSTKQDQFESKIADLAKLTQELNKADSDLNVAAKKLADGAIGDAEFKQIESAYNTLLSKWTEVSSNIQKEVSQIESDSSGVERVKDPRTELDMVGHEPDYKVRQYALGWYDKAELTSSDMSELDNAIALVAIVEPTAGAVNEPLVDSELANSVGVQVEE